VTVNGTSYDVEIAAQPGAAAAPLPALPAAAAAPSLSPSPAPAPAAGAGEVRAPISGVVLSVEVKPGDKVTPNSKVLVLEAMKMENEIFAATHGHGAGWMRASAGMTRLLA
jgi:glutaconyl-CoA/methylmalonyl-CoA decarboxylase subunit gamma